MRDAIVSLDQLVAFVGTDISDADAATVLGTIEREVLHALMGAVAKEDSSEILTLVQRLASEGVNLERLMVELVWYLRELLVTKTVSEPKEFLRLSERDLEKMKAMASFLSEADLLRALELAARAERELRWSRQPRFLVEATLLKLAHLKRLTSIEEVLARLQSESSPQGAGGSVEEEFQKLSTPPAKPKTLFQSPGESNSPSAAVKTVKTPAGADLPRPVAGLPPKAENPAALSVTSLTPVKTTLREAPSSKPPEDRTRKLVAYLEKERPSLAGALSLASRWDWSDGTLTLRFTPRHGAIRENLEKTHKAELQECLKETLGQPYELRFLSLDPSDKDIEAFAGLEDKKIQEERLREEAMQEPLVQRVLDFFKGRVVEVEKLEK
jgi:DNA polymerase III gamma/tau subunit